MITKVISVTEPNNTYINSLNNIAEGICNILLSTRNYTQFPRQKWESQTIQNLLKGYPFKGFVKGVFNVCKTQNTI